MTRRSPLRATGIILLVLTSVAAILRFLWLGSASLWIDELFSVAWSQMSSAYLLGPGVRIETNPPGYYLLLHFWMQAFGESEFAVRALSALASIATVPVVYALGRTLFGHRTALVAALLMTINPVAVAYAREARSYSWMTLADAISLWAMVAVFRSRDTAVRQSWAWLGVFVVSIIASCWLHYTSFLFAAGCYVAVASLLLRDKPFRWREAALWLVSLVIITLCVGWLVWLAMLLSDSGNLVWVPPLSWGSLGNFLLSLTVPGPETPELMPVLWGICALMLLIVLAPGRRRLPLGHPGAAVLLVVPFVYCALLVGMSAARPMLLARTATWLTVPLCLLLARGVTAWTPRWSLATGLVPILTFLICTQHGFQYPSTEDWRGASRLVATNARCQGPVLIGGFNALGFYYYKPPADRPLYVFLPDPRRRNAVEFSLSEQLMRLPELPISVIGGFIKSHPGTSVVYRDEYETIMTDLFQRVSMPAALKMNLGGGLDIICF